MIGSAKGRSCYSFKEAKKMMPAAMSITRLEDEYVTRWRGCLHTSEHGNYTQDLMDAVNTANVEYQRGIPCCDELRGLGRSR